MTAADDDHHFRAYRTATVAGVCGLFPLLINSAETPVKLVVSTVWFALVFPQVRRVVYRPLPNLVSVVVDKLEAIYLAGFVLLQIYVSILHPMLFSTAAASRRSTDADAAHGPDRGADASSTTTTTMEFLPLMLTSVYCAIGITASWLRLSWAYFSS
ncbi:hypothetical protein JCM11491_005486 [Sporobolomyces phaffii]